MSAATTRLLHIANGSCTTRLFDAAGIPGQRSVWADPLHDGPVPALSDDALVVVRARHLTGADGVVEDTAAGLRAWRQVIDDVEAYDELVLWYEHDLFDQLNLVQLLAWLGDRRTRRPVSLVCIGAFPSRPTFKGLGELTPAELAPLLGERQPVSAEACAVASRAWDAFRAPTPLPLEAFRRTDTSALPFLAAALERFLQEYPWSGDGLSRSERQLLRLVAEAPSTLAAVFPRLSDGETSYYVTDRSLDQMATTLAAATPALLALGPLSAGAPLDRDVAITDHGRSVLAGAVDRVATAGVDCWLGGVHLRATDPWRWDDLAKAIVGG